jgi:predicted ATPase
MLLVLDNYEHVMDGAHLPSELVQACPGLRILATSRERLNLEEEWVLPLPGLSLPSGRRRDGRGGGRCDAVQLFVQRAKRARMQFSLEDEEPAHVGHICRLVAGSPLGDRAGGVVGQDDGLRRDRSRRSRRASTSSPATAAT